LVINRDGQRDVGPVIPETCAFDSLSNAHGIRYNKLRIKSQIANAAKEEVVFRLYFVDTTEKERVYADRIAEQAAYFEISADAALEVGKEASEFTKQALTRPFTIYTRWRRALGRSAISRYYAIVITANGRDLNELVVSARLANLWHASTAAGWS
jgi:endonuclease YncB( thermonuclease family)